MTLADRIRALGQQAVALADDADALTAAHAAELAERDATIADLRAQLEQARPRWSADELVYLTQGPPLRADEPRYRGYGAHERKLGITNQGRDWSPGAVPKVTPPYPRHWPPTGETYTHHNVWGEATPSDGGMDPAHRDVRLHVALDYVGQLLPADDSGVRRYVATKLPAAGARMGGAYWHGGDVYSPTIKWPGRLPNPYWRLEDEGWSLSCLPMTNPDGSPKNDTAIAHWFWPSTYMPRVEITPGADVIILGRMRLTTDNPAVDVGKARFTGCVSGDAYAGPNVVVGANGRNPSLTHPRHLILGAQWRTVGLVTGTAEQIRTRPLPP